MQHIVSHVFTHRVVFTCGFSNVINCTHTDTCSHTINPSLHTHTSIYPPLSHTHAHTVSGSLLIDWEKWEFTFSSTHVYDSSWDMPTQLQCLECKLVDIDCSMFMQIICWSINNTISGYVDDLFHELETHLVNDTKPEWDSWEPPTQASTGPAYKNIEELASTSRTRGLKLKPHYLPAEDYS